MHKFQPGAGMVYTLTDTYSLVAAIKFTETLTEDEFDIGDEYRIFLGIRVTLP